MSRGTIFYLGGFELPNKNAAAHRVVANGKILRNLGFDVVFLGVDTTRVSGGLLRSSEDFFGFECWSTPYPKGLGAWLRHVVGSGDVHALLSRDRLARVVGVICYNYPAIAQWRIHALCRRIGIKHFSDATEWYDSSAGRFSHRKIKAIDTWLRMNVVHCLADGLVTTSQFMTSFYSTRGKVVVELPTLFDTNQFEPPIRREALQPKRYIYVGIPFSFGRVNAARKNLKERLDLSIDLFIDLDRAGHDFRFDIYGINQLTYLSVFPEHAEPLRILASKVTFHGRQPNEFVLSAIRQSDFSIFFRDETRVTLAGFPSKAAESISCGTPVITNNMKSLEIYRGVPGLFMAEKGEEFDLLERLNNLSPEVVEDLKEKVYHSRAFDYRKYESSLSIFLNKVGVQ